MLRAALRDLQWRRRRFAIAMAGVALVFAMSLLLTGLSAAFRSEVRRTVDAVGAERWYVSAQSSGPLTGLTPIPQALVASVPDADPIVFVRQTVDDGSLQDVNVFGVEPGGLGSPADVRSGRALEGDGEVVVDSRLGADVGDQISLGGRDLEVVGEVSGLRLYGGVPNLYVTVADAQAIGFAGQPLVTAAVTTDPVDPPPGFRSLTNGEVRADALRPLKDATRSIDLVRILLWIVAATIMGSVLYLSALERSRDFAVFKATGVSNSSITAGLLLQVFVLSLFAAVLAAVIGRLLAPTFPITVEIPTSAYLMLPIIALAVGLISAMVAMYRMIKVEPAMAFGGP